MNGLPLILIVDSNVAFATLLKEGLEQGGEYRAVVMTSGAEAVEVASAAEFDLVIVDLGLNDPDGIALAHALRQQNPTTRLMLIPLAGTELPVEANDLDVQGVLTKPFFLPELSDHVAAALRMSVEQVPVPPPDLVIAESEVDESADQVPDQAAVGQDSLADIVHEMAALAQEINAEAAILTRGEGLLAHTGRLSVEDMSGLAQAVSESWRISAQVARILGQEQSRFEQSTEGGGHSFYSLAVSGEVILSVALRANVPLGMIRHRAKTTADALRPLLDAVS